ncbi:MarR family transcriptional regulator [Haloechinothrix sp. LS1_15]|nr:MarR family transcriptional regulator [Haloechinothrix sp. LS1_15]
MEVHQAVLGELETELTKHGLTVSEFDTLINIPRDGAPMRELRDRVVLSQSALSRLVDRLERRELITREPLAEDTRAVVLALTAEGRKLARAAARTNAAVVERSFGDRLSEHELATMRTALARLKDELT